MGVSVMKVFEYIVECDNCEASEVYHTFDWDNCIQIHDKRTAPRPVAIKSGTASCCVLSA